ncbi:MAG TPA: DHA2 family efflux MFS transporter permease subunit [Gammaproteobacteria bacterium]|nr:DHA2 family efflux MFS transporter permease subunit [Gammaproteobacteria bacterium]
MTNGIAAGASAERIAPGTLMALVAMGLAVFVLANDFTAMSVALTQIEHDFNSDVTTVQWVINAYALVFGVLIVTGGKLADMFGRRRIFFVGTAIFALFSFLGGIAPNVIWLIGARALMGIGGAMMWPAILGMTFAALPERKAGLAGGMILGIAGLGNAVGPLVGGLLTDAFGWRWIFFLNLPIALIAVVVTWAKVHQPAERAPGQRLDYLGVAVLSLGLIALLVALDQANSWGFSDYRTLILFALCVLLLASFPFVERRAGANALLPAALVRNRQFMAACVSILLLSSTFFAALLYLPEFMQKLLDYSALRAGLGLLPLMASFALVSFVAGALYERLGAKLVTALGAACMTVGVLFFSMIGPDAGYGSFVGGMILLGVGLGLFLSSATTAGVVALEHSQASLAGGVLYLFQIAGGSVGLGLVTAVFISGALAHVHAADAANQLNGMQEQAVMGVLAGTSTARQLLEQFPALGAHLAEVARAAFAAGMHASFRIVGVLGALGFVVALVFLGGRLHVWRKVGTPGPELRRPSARFHHRAYHWGRAPERSAASAPETEKARSI